jgi:spore maturation protein CgeB
MRFVYFTQSIASCWNHGNAHFLRGVLRELLSRGHNVRIFEPGEGWSRTNLLRDHGNAAIDDFRACFPELVPELYGSNAGLQPMLDPMLDGADVVLVHEWTDPSLVAAIGRQRQRGRFLLLFHDTHHRVVSDPDEIQGFDLSAYDGVLAFGEAVAEVYRRRGWGERVFVWHEAADTRLFRPPANEVERQGLVWIGNWGDGERSGELTDFLLRPAAAACLPLDIFGVRYPEEARRAIARHGARYHGWLANAKVPETFARYIATVHVPRRFYTQLLPGIPTIRVFEALACGIPLVSAPWRDSEGLFRPGRDFLVARSEQEMTQHLRALANDPAQRAELAANGLQAITQRHSCAHRVDALLSIIEELLHPARRGAA